MVRVRVRVYEIMSIPLKGPPKYGKPQKSYLYLEIYSTFQVRFNKNQLTGTKIQNSYVYDSYQL